MLMHVIGTVNIERNNLEKDEKKIFAGENEIIILQKM